ncbi:peroxidase family protein [Lentzea sp. NPDC004782]|uniref:peroxidase family protein n=1 Tax=Lentzea sp. NPDC004782 TaxID=3154458 RepID=UPI0033B71EF7
MQFLRRAVALVAVGTFLGSGVSQAESPAFEIQGLDGHGNNRAHPDWGTAGEAYTRLAPTRYADGVGQPVAGPNARYVSNRIFADGRQNLPSDRDVSQWAQVWAQFMDHTFGLREDTATDASVPWDNEAPMEHVRNDLGSIPMRRSGVVDGVTPHQQMNIVSSYLDGWAVYGGTQDRLTWLRDGAKLLLPNNMLPRRQARGGDGADAPVMTGPFGAITTGNGVVAGDMRANENATITAVQTLFAREHNRIVDRLPSHLSDEEKFQIARKVVIAEQQWITYQEFLPAMGVRLAPYRGYRPDVRTSLANEFATVGYRSHSMVRGDFEVVTNTSRYPAQQLDTLRARGMSVTVTGDQVEIGIPPRLLPFNPDLVDDVQLGPLLQSFGRQPENRNDEVVDEDALRSIVFLIPGCVPRCLTAVIDVAALDVERGRDHGIAAYNDLRRAYGLAPKPSFRAISGEPTESFPTDPELTPGDEINDPNSLDYLRPGVRRTTTAARLKAIYGDVSGLDAIVGMMAEPRLPGSEFGELQHAIWKKQFEALRDGDRFFYANDPALRIIKARYGVDYRRSLGDVIAANTDIRRGDLAYDVFRAHPPVG